MQLDAAISDVVMPNVELFGGTKGMMQLSSQLSMISGSFTLTDLPQFEFEMQQAAESFNRNVWPRLDFLPKFSMRPLLNFALIARLVIDLRALEIDPFDVDFFPGGEPVHPGYHDFRFKLSPPKLHLARLMAGLPNLLNLNQTFELPPLGDPGAHSAMLATLTPMAHLTLPKLIVPLPVIAKMAMVLESLATIQEAFGPDGFSPMGLGRIQRMLRLWGGVPVSIPMPALALKAKLDVLPSLEDVQLGLDMAGDAGSSALVGAMSFSPPKLAFLPMLNLIMALNASMEMMLDIPAFDMCGSCNCC
ncbi:hypothetical protein [Loktanella sp. D2R18]|uniref:hypothetical protein n=2 Tax=Rhodobacterales TaxID=204455 RepID=UPI0015F0549E|nr:hypothetical protein [Loktanella sp. D2R18]